ncbi:NAD-dependent epimerase/dehydratase family protein [Leptospira biflexa]|uniref:NAD-dependent epimerase/dehydratase family protein n=1 Tax=Leptospira biflexa TaxID=172 RepID=UPI00108419C4|nr:NAD(P)-dependent oxidoreductase [Leptospira biflexa]TGM31794.1 NAD(P)-dependent oxidoreductase [Leptospira biflexa]TGM36937.1 NAD(P)-dependent oxidoreductase [Leptospira biflexa]
MTKTILITGGSGVLGKALIEKLIPDTKIIAIGTNHSHFPEIIRHHKHFKFYERDLNLINNANDLNLSEPIDLILHLAAVVSGAKVEEATYYQINVYATKHLVSFAIQNRIPHFGFVSSISVYGSKETELTLKSERNGKTIYAKTKSLAEDFVFQSGQNYSVLRLASIYGKGTKSFVSKLKALMQKGVYPKIPPSRTKSILHIDDATEALYLWTKQCFAGKKPEPLYVFSHPEAVTIEGVIQTFQSLGITKKRQLPIPVTGILSKLLELFLRTLSWIRKKPFHGSPLQPLLESVSIYDAGSWEKIGYFPKSDLRKGLLDYQL